MKTIRVSAAVITDGSRILATERGYGEYKGGWEFPGGKREEGESGEDTVIREIKEELGADITVDRCLIPQKMTGKIPFKLTILRSIPLFFLVYPL